MTDRERALAAWLHAWGAFRAGHVCSSRVPAIPLHDESFVSWMEAEFAAVRAEGESISTRPEPAGPA